MLPSHIGAEIKVVKPAGVAPAARTAGTVNGTAIDVRDFESAVLMVQTGAITGAPTSQTVDSKLQKSDDGSTGWTDLVPSTPYPGSATAAIPQITAANAEKHVDVNLAGVNYVREVSTVAFVAGTAPTIVVASALVLGGAKKAPVAAY